MDFESRCEKVRTKATSSAYADTTSTSESAVNRFADTCTPNLARPACVDSKAGLYVLYSLELKIMVWKIAGIKKTRLETQYFLAN